LVWHGLAPGKHYSPTAAIAFCDPRLGVVAALGELISVDNDRVMIIDLGPNDGRVGERIEFLGVHALHVERKFIIEFEFRFDANQTSTATIDLCLPARASSNSRRSERRILAEPSGKISSSTSLSGDDALNLCT